VAINRGVIIAAARHALSLHQWIVAPDFDQEGAVQQAERHLAGFTATAGTPLLATAHGLQAWLVGGGARAPIRSALVRAWVRHRVLLVPVPLTGAAALPAEAPFTPSTWPPVFLRALAAEAANARQGLTDLERAFTARARVSGRRRDSHAAAAVDLLAATPLLSATTLGHGLGLSIKTGTRLLDGLVAGGVAIEVTHRAKRQLFGLAGMAPLAQAVRSPYRPEPGRGRGRPLLRDDEPVLSPPAPLRPLTSVERRQFDYSDLEHWMDHLDQTIRRTRQSLQVLARPAIDLSSLDSTVASLSTSCAGD
jgi:hypothetical protein